MPFTSEDHDTLTSILNAVPVPMFAAERYSTADPFHFICVNLAHSRKTGLLTENIRNKRPAEILSPQDAANVESQYLRCAAIGRPLTYEERLVLNGAASDWNTTLQPFDLPDGRQRIVGTAIVIERAPIHETLDDAAYYSALAQMQVGKLRQFLTVVEKRRDVPRDLRGMAMMVGNITQSIDAVLDDIRALSEPPTLGIELQNLQRPELMH